MTAVALDDVTVALDGHRILHGVTLRVAGGAWLGLIGPNGAGKTTLLRAIAGVTGHGGGLMLGDADPAALSQRRLSRLVAVVPQRPTVPPGMTVTDYVLLGRSPYIPYLGVESRRDMAVVGDLLARLDLTGFGLRVLSSLSGGELQRAVLARALAQQAPILLLDEPTSALDVGHQQQVLELVDQLRHEHDLTVVSATHDLTLAGQFADQLVLLAGGRVVAAGSARQVLTEATIGEHYSARVRVLEHPDGGIVLVPRRARSSQIESARAGEMAP